MRVKYRSVGAALPMGRNETESMRRWKFQGRDCRIAREENEIIKEIEFLM